MWNQDPRLAGGGNLYEDESHCPGPKMWNQDPRLAGRGNWSHYPGPKIKTPWPATRVVVNTWVRRSRIKTSLCAIANDVAWVVNFYGRS